MKHLSQNRAIRQDYVLSSLPPNPDLHTKACLPLLEDPFPRGFISFQFVICENI